MENEFKYFYPRFQEIDLTMDYSGKLKKEYIQLVKKEPETYLDDITFSDVDQDIVDKIKQYYEKIDSFGLDPFAFISNALINNDFFEKTKIPKIQFTNAWRKMYEICERFKFVPKKDKVRHFDICGFPGAFILATNHYAHTKAGVKNYDWTLQSYNDETQGNKYFGDKFNLLKKYPNKFNFGKSGVGDVSDKNTVLEYIEEYKDNKFDITTSDCGVYREEDDKGGKNRNKYMSKLYFGAAMISLGCLAEGGNFLMKYYMPSSNLDVDLVYLLSFSFETFKMIKPEHSRQTGGKEIYFIGIGYKNNISSSVFKKLLEILDKEDACDYSFFDEKFINIDIINHIKKNFVNYFEKLSVKIKKQGLETQNKAPLKLLVDGKLDEYIKKLNKFDKETLGERKKWLNNSITKLNIVKMDRKYEL